MPTWLGPTFIVLIALLAACIVWVVLSEREHRRSSHRKTTGPGEACYPPGGPPGAGSMILAEERRYQTACFPPAGEWNRGTTESDGGWDQRYALYNGHTWGCLNPSEDHPGACPEEGDWPDDDWPGNLPDLPPVDPVLDDERAGLVGAALALAADDPGDAGWTDQLLADLRDAPTILDRPTFNGAPVFDVPGLSGHWVSRPPEPSRIADTGEIELASLRAEYAAELRAQDDDVAEFISRKVSEAAEYKLTIHGLA